MLVETIELQALKNQFYLELKHQKEESVSTMPKKKGRKWGGTPNVIGLGARCLDWKKKYCGAKDWKDKRLNVCLHSFLHEHPSIVPLLTLHPSIMKNTSTTAASASVLRNFFFAKKNA